MKELLKNLMGELGGELVNSARGCYELPGRGVIRSMSVGFDVSVIVDGQEKYAGSFMRPEDAVARLIEQVQ